MVFDKVHPDSGLPPSPVIINHQHYVARLQNAQCKCASQDGAQKTKRLHKQTCPKRLDSASPLNPAQNRSPLPLKLEVPSNSTGKIASLYVGAGVRRTGAS
jgi:hypothetical protein